ncbi:hypothetical protein JNG57_04030 [Mycoplasmopsis bovis]|nr:hypothetical protein [Mycoplasmopsis bovis]MBT1321085.1 hypothetical protein [Mycoplasmopsis bovis]MBT1325237.1 hypothetical protein [Mycoplasmopsis bovis]MBT1326443.1 hypothetical protein [Mycoplasmopsis bovis]MBT1328240.1 hypothetical protein [Mycoplasmopsis bovis]
MIDYIQDLDLIVSAFKAQYNISPDRILKLKGKEFIAYLSALSDDTLLSKVITARSLDDSQLPDGYKELKKRFKLSPVASENSANSALVSFAQAMGRKGL